MAVKFNNLFKEITNISTKDATDTSRRLNKLFEEAGEFAQAVNKDLGIKSHKQTPAQIRAGIVEEAADTIQCVIAVLARYDVTPQEVLDEMAKKNEKWKGQQAERSEKVLKETKKMFKGILRETKPKAK